MIRSMRYDKEYAICHKMRSDIFHQSYYWITSFCRRAEHLGFGHSHQPCGGIESERALEL